jgi:hypothetical protein
LFWENYHKHICMHFWIFPRRLWTFF